MDEIVNVEIDHKIPKKYGGQSIMGNFQLLHNFCHDKKTAMDFKLKML